jgi:hypothetical protein
MSAAGAENNVEARYKQPQINGALQFAQEAH